MTHCKSAAHSFLILVLFCGFTSLGAADSPVKVQVHWDKTIRVLKTKPTLLLGASSVLSPGAPLHDRILKTIKDLGADDVRYAGGGYVYPHFGVPELKPPTATKTFWDFSYIDPVTEDVMKATAGHPLVLNFSAIPEWMFKTPAPVPYPADPTMPAWQYEQGKELRDPTAREVGEYFARVVAWHVKGGFTDELGKWHESGHHWKVDYWEVLNEPDIEHGLSAETYTKIYDAVAEAVHKVSPQTKFVGISDSYPSGHSKFFEYFLNHKNHQPGIPLDMISYHFYAVPNPDEPVEAHQFTFFNQADRFLEIVGYLETLRNMLSPQTGTMVNEIGTMLPEDWTQNTPGYKFTPIRPAYWNLSAAIYAYVYAGLARMGIDDAAESGIPCAPGLWPSIAMLDWNTAQPNARFWVLKMIHDHFHPGDTMVETSSDSGYVMTQAMVSRGGERKLLVVNKRDREFEIVLPESAGAKIEVVDQTTGSNPPASSSTTGSTFNLGGFGVAVVTLGK
jgi:Glycosyl hydrolases family 39